MNSQDYDYLLDIVLLGRNKVGKTSLMNRYIDNTFDPKCYSTIGFDLKTKIVNIKNQKIKVQIRDYGLSGRFAKVQPIYYRKAHGILILYDITNNSSFYEVREWLDKIELNASSDTRKL